jgi:ribosomal protein S18 acetylase RimI-like enzyme
MTVRRLHSGDEGLVADACRFFGLAGDITPATFLQRPETTLLVAEAHDELAGWVYGHELVHPDGERTMLLYALDVAEAHRGHGHATNLVAAFVDDARLRGCTEVWVLTDSDNDAGLATYTAAGGLSDGGVQVMFTWRLAGGNHS